ncbi:hypothetical protein [Shewanella algae]|nr:hypothetical protein [Shewanella algae]
MLINEQNVAASTLCHSVFWQELIEDKPGQEQGAANMLPRLMI